MSKYQINQINQIDQDLDFVFDVVCSSSCKSFACVFGALVQTCTITQENVVTAATAYYCMLLHATACYCMLLLSALFLFLFLTVRPRRQSRKSFTKK